MADINYRGTLLANQGYVLRDDEYEDDELGDEEKKAKVLFLPSKYSVKGWEVKLGVRENIISIAQGNIFSSVFTSKNFVRFFSPEGKEFFILGARSVLTMTAYDNLLAILYHGNSPFTGDQCIRVKVFNASTLRVSIDTPVVISNNSKVKWFGFSSQGNLFIQDTHDILWTLVGRNSWSPVLEKRIWIVGIDDNLIHGVKLGYGEKDPNPLADLNPSTFEMKMPLTTPDYDKLSLGVVQREQLEFRKDVWGHMAHCVIKTPEDNERSRMPDVKTCNREKVNRDKEKSVYAETYS